jgi:hypothetical protein
MDNTYLLTIWDRDECPEKKGVKLRWIIDIDIWYTQLQKSLSLIESELKQFFAIFYFYSLNSISLFPLQEQYLFWL